MRGQLSAEMLIVLVLILGIVLIVYSQLSSNVKSLSDTATQKTEKLENSTRLLPGEVVCSDDNSCKKFDEAWECDVSRGHCIE